MLVRSLSACGPTVTPTSLLAGGRNEEREDREDQPSKNQSPSKNFVASANPLVSEGAWHSQPYRKARASYRLIIIRQRQGQQRYRPKIGRASRRERVCKYV